MFGANQIFMAEAMAGRDAAAVPRDPQPPVAHSAGPYDGSLGHFFRPRPTMADPTASVLRDVDNAKERHNGRRRLRQKEGSGTGIGVDTTLVVCE